MNAKRTARFIKDVSPVLIDLNKQWFEPGQKSPDGYYYACPHCDMECGGHKNHDFDCLIDLAKKVLHRFNEIDSDSKFTKHQVGPDTGKRRKPKEIEELRNYFKELAILRILYQTNLNQLVPLDYSDPAARNAICGCGIQSILEGQGRRHRYKHHPKCPVKKLANALIRRMR